MLILSDSSEDWSIATGGTTLPKVIASLNTWYTGTISTCRLGLFHLSRTAGPKSPGLIILEHELDNNTSGAFIQTYSGIKANNWTAVSTVELFEGAYQNANENTGEVLSMDVAGPTPTPPSSTSASIAPSSPNSTSTASASPNNNIEGKNSAIRTHEVAVSSLLLLVGIVMSVFH